MIAASGQIARLPANGGPIPGRATASGVEIEVPGKTWSDQQCLFVSDVRFVALDVAFQDEDRDGEVDLGEEFERRRYGLVPPGTLGREYLDVSASKLIKDAGPGVAPALFFRSKLFQAGVRNNFPDGKCPEPGGESGPRCPRVAIYFRGAPAPCSIWPW
jgi:hypothetical protein